MAMIVFTRSSWDGNTENIHRERQGAGSSRSYKRDDNPDWGCLTGTNGRVRLPADPRPTRAQADRMTRTARARPARRPVPDGDEAADRDPKARAICDRPDGYGPSSPAPEDVLVSLGDSWPEGAHCNGCRTFPQTYAEGLADELGEPVTLVDLAGQAQPSFDTPGKGGSAGLLEAIRTDEPFREQVASGDIIVIATGANDFGAQFEAIQGGTCGGEDGTACVDEIGRTWIASSARSSRDRGAPGGRADRDPPVNAANAFSTVLHPEQARASRRCSRRSPGGLRQRRAHGAVCVDVRPALNGPNLDAPVNDSSQSRWTRWPSCCSDRRARTRLGERAARRGIDPRRGNLRDPA
jgi:hypothetical protein